MNTNKLVKPRKVKFLLVPRPQKDPLAADNDAPQHVLVPKGDIKVEQIAQTLPDFDPQLFVSKEETKVGMLERAQIESKLMDPDILTAMSKDFNFEDPNNILDDDFVDQAGGMIEDTDMTDNLDDLFDDEDEVEVINFNDMKQETAIGDDVKRHGHSDNNEEFEDEDDFEEYPRNFKRRDDDNRSTFTGCSMTSSVMRRSQGLQQIDEHFEKFFEEQYADDTEIGALDLNEVRGDQLLTNINEIHQLKREIREVRKRNHGDDYEPEIVSEHHKQAIIGDDDAQKDFVEVEVKEHENKIDCESILSYNSNIYNHPKLIIEPHRRKTTSTTRSDASDCTIDSKSQQSLVATLARLSVRPQNETPEERKARKKAIKELRQERRQERKQNQHVFKSEHAKLMKQQRSNMPALKLA